MNRLLRIGAAVIRLKRSLYPNHSTLIVEITALDNEITRDELGKQVLANLESVEAAELRGYVAAKQEQENNNGKEKEKGQQ